MRRDLSALAKPCCNTRWVKMAYRLLSVPCRQASAANPDQKAAMSDHESNSSINASLDSHVWNILVLCTGNSARSIMAEGLFNVIGKGRFRAFSAGSRPIGQVNPFAVEKLEAVGYDLSSLRSKSWDEFATPDAPQMDFVITVCDDAAGEVCPVWPGVPVTAHWNFEDPDVLGTDEHKRAAFHKVFEQIRLRVSLFAALPLHALDHMAIHHEVQRIGCEPHDAT